MKFPISMLHDFVNTPLGADEIGDLLTMAGFELEGIEDVEGEPVLDIKVVSNRGDGLSVFGLSREVMAKDKQSEPTELYRKVAKGYMIGDENSPAVSSKATVRIETEMCSRFGCRVFEGVSNQASPERLQKRLRQAGMRPLGLLVDLTNYVMLELGQPLHAYDLDKLCEATIIVRQARPGETLKTLDGTQHKLRPHNMLICDAGGPIGLAGVMGGLETEVGGTTRNVLLEAAHFVNTSVRKTRKEAGLSTEASYRFERSVDPEGVVRAINRVADLLSAEIGRAALAVSGVIDIYPRPPKMRSIPVRVSRASALLGMPVGIEEARAYLERLGFDVKGSGEPFEVESPTWRPDIVREIDLIEEIGRVHGFERIPTEPPQGSTPLGGLHGLWQMRDDVKDCWLESGLSQTISHSLRDIHLLDDPQLEHVGPNHPGSPEMAWLRNSLYPSLCDAAQRNGSRDLSLFEIGRIHGRREGQLVERVKAAFLSTGALINAHWHKSDPPQADFFSAKGLIEAALDVCEREYRLEASSDDPRLHPTRQARLAGCECGAFGSFGQIHPDLAEQLGLPQATVLGEFDIECVHDLPHREQRLSKMSRNPAVRRDISVQISKSVLYETIETAVGEACGEVLEKMWLFDVYVGKGIPEGDHSLSIALQLRKHGENFTDEEANQVRDRAVAALAALGGAIR